MHHAIVFEQALTTAVCIGALAPHVLHAWLSVLRCTGLERGSNTTTTMAVPEP
jgi:hypothetical protein